MKKKPIIIVIVGPTATGKSDLAVTIAKKIDGEIISADSRQVYKGLDIGSGKITTKEMKGIPHHLLDVVSPTRTFTASQFKTKAEKAINKILKNKKIPIIVGGTGFYIQTITDNIDLPSVKPDKKLRSKLQKKSAEELVAILKSKDPQRLKTIDQKNKVRLIRAIELSEILGYTPKLTKNKSPYSFIKIGLNPGKEEVYEKIKTRLRRRLNQGLIKEVKNLRSQLTDRRLRDLGLEYRFINLYLKKELDREMMVKKLETAINQYAKRQTTWFKKDKEISWFKDPQKALEFINKKIN